MQAVKNGLVRTNGVLRAGWLCLAMLIGGCNASWIPFLDHREEAPGVAPRAEDYTYIIGPGDNLNVFVWRNAELSTSVAVRPDGKFSTSLVEDLQASGKTPSELAREIEQALAEYIRDPLVTVTVGGFVGEYYEQVRVVGEAQNPVSIPYRRNMSLLDLMISVGGLTEFAAGNRSTLVRIEGDGQKEYRVRVEDLIKDGDITANVAMQPGDILIIPEAWF